MHCLTSVSGRLTNQFAKDVATATNITQVKAPKPTKKTAKREREPRIKYDWQDVVRFVIKQAIEASLPKDQARRIEKINEYLNSKYDRDPEHHTYELFYNKYFPSDFIATRKAINSIEDRGGAARMNAEDDKAWIWQQLIGLSLRRDADCLKSRQIINHLIAFCVAERGYHPSVPHLDEELLLVWHFDRSKQETTG